MLQYDLYANGTYQHVGITRQTVSTGVFEFEVFHEGAVAVTDDTITFEAFRATASRTHPETPADDYREENFQPRTSTLNWRIQIRNGERFLVLGDGSTPAVVYRHLGRPSSPTRARQRPLAPAAAAGSTATASGALVDWFRVYADQGRSVHTNQRTGWTVLSTHGAAIVHVIDRGIAVHDVNLSGIPQDGTFVSFTSDGYRLPVEFG